MKRAETGDFGQSNKRRKTSAMATALQDQQSSASISTTSATETSETSTSTTTSTSTSATQIKPLTDLPSGLGILCGSMQAHPAAFEECDQAQLKAIMTSTVMYTKNLNGENHPLRKYWKINKAQAKALAELQEAINSGDIKCEDRF